jgi:putative nucleotidyltransferase with HDIG domain
MKRSYYPVYRIVIIYVLFSLVWILVSDRLVEFFVSDSNLLGIIQTYKGTFFVLTSGVLLFFLLLRELHLRESAWEEYDREKTELLGQLSRKTVELEQAYDATIEGWALALDMRNREVKEHSQRVTAITIALARQMGLDDEQIAQMRRGSLLHDIGKMSIPDEILQKNGPLSDEERRIVEQHPSMAYEMLSSIQFLQPALDIPRYHHEKWNGTGYPYHLKGTEIPLAYGLFAALMWGLTDICAALAARRFGGLMTAAVVQLTSLGGLYLFADSITR